MPPYTHCRPRPSRLARRCPPCAARPQRFAPWCPRRFAQWCPPRFLGAAALLLALAAPAGTIALGAMVGLHASAEMADAAPGVFEFARLNRSYRMDDSEVAPVRRGPVTIHLSSPRNTLVLKGHHLSLTPLGDGLHRVSVGLDLMGSGDLTADLVTDAGTSSRLEDLVVVPRQTVRVDGRVSFERVAGGWDVTAHSLPQRVELDVQSRLAGSLVTLCGQMAVFLGLDCDGLDRSLSRVGVPMPPAGSVFHLPEEELTADEVARLDAYLSGR